MLSAIASDCNSYIIAIIIAYKIFLDFGCILNINNTVTVYICYSYLQFRQNTIRCGYNLNFSCILDVNFSVSVCITKEINNRSSCRCYCCGCNCCRCYCCSATVVGAIVVGATVVGATVVGSVGSVVTGSVGASA